MYKIFISFALTLNFAIIFCSNSIDLSLPVDQENFQPKQDCDRYKKYSIAKKELESYNLSEKTEQGNIEQFILVQYPYNIIFEFNNRIFTKIQPYFINSKAKLYFDQINITATNQLEADCTIFKLQIEAAKRRELNSQRRGSDSGNHAKILEQISKEQQENLKPAQKSPQKAKPNIGHTRRGSDPLLQSALINKVATAQQQYQKIKLTLDRSLSLSGRRPSKDMQDSEEKAKLAEQQAEQERLAREKLEQERKEQAERERLKREEQDKAEAYRKKLADEQLAHQKKLKDENDARELATKMEDEKIIARFEADFEAHLLLRKKEQEERIRIEQEKTNQERIAKEKADQARVEQEQALEQVRFANEKAKRERIKREEDEKHQRELDALRKKLAQEHKKQNEEFTRKLKEKNDAKELADRQTREKQRQEARAKEERERQEKLAKDKLEQDKREMAKKRESEQVVIEDETAQETAKLKEELKRQKEKLNSPPLSNYCEEPSNTNNNIPKNTATNINGKDKKPKQNVNNDDLHARCKEQAEQEEIARKLKNSNEQSETNKTKITGGSNFIKGFVGIFCALIIYNFFDKPSKKNKDEEDDENNDNDKDKESKVIEA